MQELHSLNIKVSDGKQGPIELWKCEIKKC